MNKYFFNFSCDRERKQKKKDTSSDSYPNESHLMHSNGVLRYTSGRFNAYRGMAPPSMISDSSMTPPPEYYKIKSNSTKTSDTKSKKSKDKSVKPKKPDIYAKPNKKNKKKVKKESNKGKSSTSSETDGSLKALSSPWPDATDEANVAANYATIPGPAANLAVREGHQAIAHPTGYTTIPSHPAKNHANLTAHYSSTAVPYLPNRSQSPVHTENTDYSSNTYSPTGMYSPNPGAPSYTANSGYGFGFSYTDYNYPGSRYGSMPHPISQPKVHNNHTSSNAFRR